MRTISEAEKRLLEKQPKRTTQKLPGLDEQLTLFAGSDAWHFPGCKSLDYSPLQVADCGHGVTLVAPPYGSATCFPTSVGMAATWNRDLLEEVGKALGRETRAKNCSILLGPMVNLHRLPCGGRNYETFSEDPVLTGKMAAAIIRGIQSEGTSACIKSFACNNQQHEQKVTSSEVDLRTLHELYLKAFRIAFEESDPWAVMTSYNPVNQALPGDSSYWINEILRKEMGFDGVVVSDWGALQGEGAIIAGVDIEMPGPGKILCEKNLRKALSEGLIDESEINRRARRVLQLHERCAPARLGEQSYSPPELDSPRHRELSRKVAEEGIVLIKNENRLLPFSNKQIKCLAVIGPNAATARLGGGGSASVSPFYAISPLAGIRKAAGPEVEVLYAEGCSLGNARPSIPTEFLATPDGAFGDGLCGDYFEVEAFNNGGKPSKTQNDPTIDFSWGWAAPATGLPREYYVARWSGRLRLPEKGTYLFSLTTQEGVGRVRFDSELVLDAWSEYDETNFEDSYMNRHAECEITGIENQEIEVIIEYRKTGTRGGMHLGWKKPFQTDAVEEAVRIAEKADAVVIVGGLSNIYEGGAYDRRFFELPGRQNELIQRVASANPKTAVVLKSGTPVSLSGWIEHVPAILQAFYPGQEGGNSIGRILFGEVNPSGKLPDTLPNTWEEVPAMKYYPGENGKVHYGERLMVGYRHYDASRLDPAFPFGFGLSYTTFEISSPNLTGGSLKKDGATTVTVQVTNTGKCSGSEVVQLYLEWVNPPQGRPPRALIDFVKVHLKPGQAKSVSLTLRYCDILTYNPDSKAWLLEH